MPSTASKHRTKPPCNCRDCIRATAKADQRRAEIAEIAAILERLDDLDRLAEVRQ